MYMDSIIITSLLTVGSVIVITGGIVYYAAKEGKKRDPEL